MDRKRLLLTRARELIARIRRYTAEGEAAFCSNPMIQDAVLRNLEIIGQIIRDLEPAWLDAQDPGIPWKRIAGMRNQLAHAYLGIDLKVVWQVVAADLEPLDRALGNILTAGLSGGHP